MMQETRVILALAALAQPLRLRLFRALVVAGPAGLTPGVLVEALRVPPTGLSFHLKELTQSGLVTQERRGRHLIYRAAFARMNDVLSYLTENCCRDDACVASDAAACRC